MWQEHEFAEMHGRGGDGRLTLTFEAVLASAGIDPAEALVIRHAYVREHEDGTVGIQGDSFDDEIMAYTRVQSANTRTFPAAPPKFWIVFLPRGGDRARLWSVVVNHGEIAHDGVGARSISNTPTSWQTYVTGWSSGGGRREPGESTRRRRPRIR